MDGERKKRRVPQAARIIGYLKQHRRVIFWGLLALVGTDVLALIPPWLVKNAIDSLPSLTASSDLLPYLGVILLVVTGQAVLRFTWRRSLLGVSRWVEYRLRNDLFRHLQQMDRGFFLKRLIGDLMSRSTNDLRAVQELIAYFGLLIVDSLLTIGTCLVLMGLIDPLLTFTSLLPMPFLSILFFYFGRRVRKKSLEVQGELAGLTQVVQETVVGIRTIQAYTLEWIRQRQYRHRTDEYVRKNLELANLRGLFFASLTFFAGFSAVIVIWVGGSRVVKGDLSLGGFVAFGAYLMMLVWPMMSFGFMVNLFQRGRASLERLDEVFQEQPAIVDPHRPVFLKKPKGAIRFEEVSFRHNGVEAWALNQVSFDIPPGSKAGITGPVGSGKSTLLELIPRIHDPSKGSVLLDGQDTRHLTLQDLRLWVSFVAQEPFLFSDSLSANMRFGVPESQEEEIERIAGLVRLDRDQENFHDGMKTVVGEKGVMLSGGQRQRLALGRAIMMGPRVLLLDDAFAHLDEETESEVMENLLTTLPKTTIIFTSHRISSLRRADRVLVLGGGRVLQEGEPNRLLRIDGYLKEIYERQIVLQEMKQWEKEEPS
jgi:ATP-binding cassette subfamily B protein